MLRLTRKADYGLRLMLEVAAQGEGPVTTARVAQRQQMPYPLLRKVGQTLVSQGLLVSERGAGGGVRLARPAEATTVLEIVRTFESPALNRCTVDPPSCDRRSICAVYPVWAEAQYEVERVLAGTSLAQLVERHSALARTGHPARRGGTRAGGPRDERRRRCR